MECDLQNKYTLIANQSFEDRLSRLGCYDSWYDDYDYVVIDEEYVIAVVNLIKDEYEVYYMGFPEFEFTTSDKGELIRMVAYHHQNYREIY